MKLTIVGSSGSMSGPTSAASCYLVQAVGPDPETGLERVWSLVMDLGPGGFGQLWTYLEPRDLDALLITHGHADHLADIISFQVYLRWNPGGDMTGMPLYGPAQISDRVHQIDGYMSKREKCAFDHRTVNAGSTFKVGPMTVTAFPGQHPIESYGFRVEGPSVGGDQDVVIAYTGDTDLCAGMEAMADGADLLLAECGFTEADSPRGIHMTGKRVGELSLESQAKVTVLTHIQPWTDPAVPVAEFELVTGRPPQLAAPGKAWEL